MKDHMEDVLDLSSLTGDFEGGSKEWKVYKAALTYAEAGYYVIPIIANGKGLPPKRYKITYTNATRSKKTIERWFNIDDGTFRGWNLGIATGRAQGSFVIDVDVHGEKNGFNTLESILDEEKEEMPPGPAQTTPNGGKHHFFRWQDNAVSSTEKIGEGIDTRGGTEDACKGHVVVFPSTIDGKPYLWETGGPLPSVPKWAMERMGVPWRPQPRGDGGGRGNEQVTDSDMEEMVPVAQIERMLASIDPDEVSYEDWLKIGMAIKSQYPDDDGMDIWDEWSKHGERYEPGECKLRWNGFSDVGAVRMATLFYFADQHGHVGKPADKKPNKLGMITERLNEHHAVVVTGNKIRILRELEGEVEEMSNTYHLLGRQDFRTLMENDTVCVDPQKGKYMSVSDIWLGDPNRRTFPKGLGMFPGGEPDGYYNTWKGFATKPVPGDCSLFKDHILNTLCRGDADLNTFVLDWCADLFQNPSEPQGTAIVMRGDEGTGKGTFANTIGMMCAPHYTHLIDENHLTGQFNSHMSDSIVVFADEITWGGNRKTAGKLKGLVTERYMLLERKGIDAVSQRNMVHMLIASNSEWVIPAGINSRRWLVLDVSSSKMGNTKYFDKVNDELKNGGREAFMHEMLEREITSNLTRAPVTEALEDQRAMSAQNEDTVMGWWSRAIMSGTLMSEDLDDKNNVGWPSSVHKTDVYSEYEMWCMERKVHVQPSNTFFKKALKYGFTAARKSIGGKRFKVYSVPHHREAIAIVEKLTNIKMEMMYED